MQCKTVCSTVIIDKNEKICTDLCQFYDIVTKKCLESCAKAITVNGTKYCLPLDCPLLDVYETTTDKCKTTCGIRENASVNESWVCLAPCDVSQFPKLDGCDPGDCRFVDEKDAC